MVKEKERDTENGNSWKLRAKKCYWESEKSQGMEAKFMSSCDELKRR